VASVWRHIGQIKLIRKAMSGKFLLLWILLILVISISSVPTYSTVRNSSGINKKKSEKESTEAAKSRNNSIYSISDNCEIRVYDADFNLIRIGSENCKTIKKLLPRMDFITEINGIKFFILNHQNQTIVSHGLTNSIVAPVL
jgi:hypothetical protein